MLWACVDCTARYAVGAPACPQCGSTRYQEAPGGAVEEGAPVFDGAPEATAPAGAKTSKAKAATPDTGSPDTAAEAKS